MEERITGVMIYYYFVCKRKLWYFCHDLQMENVSQNENIQLGKLLDETSYRRNQKHINIDDTINIDFIKDFQEIHEVKKSKSIEEAGIWQVKYYLYYLKKKGASCIIKMWMLKIENTSEYNKTTDLEVSKNLIEQRGIYNEV